MAQSQVSCPNCRKPVIADIEQLFDTGIDPQNKQRILSGQFNLIQCPSCGYQGMLPVPIVYHDPEKELLLTYFPPELGLPVNEQEKRLGPVITRVFNNLPADKRKGYLLQPRTMFTMQTMVETILEADGITKEMIHAQQQKINLIQKLLTASPDSRKVIIQQEDKMIDNEFFSIFSRLIQVTMQQGDQEGAQQLAALQQELLTGSTVGKELYEQSREAEAAIKSLQDAGKDGLTREKLLDLVIDAPTKVRLTTLVSLARSGFDYTFFELLSKKIDEAEGEEKTRLTQVRTDILETIDQIEEAIKVQMEQAKTLLDQILAAPDLQDAIVKNASVINELFVEQVRSELQKARETGDLERSAKLQNVVDVLQKMSAPPPEVEFIEQLLTAKTDEEMTKMLEENKERLTPELMNMLAGVIAQNEQQGLGGAELEALKKVNKLALRQVMKANLAK